MYGVSLPLTLSICSIYHFVGDGIIKYTFLAYETDSLSLRLCLRFYFICSDAF